MKINLMSITEFGSHKSIKREIELPDITYRKQKIDTPFPFLIELDAYKTNDSFILSGQLSGKLILTCSRCLEQFNYPIEIQLEEELRKEEIDDLENIDINNLLIENILLDLPMKTICSQECRGLCSSCGQNLNQADCDCKEDNIDPRLAKLKEFFVEED